MKQLAGKTILFCRRREDSSAFESALRNLGAEVEFFPTFKIQYQRPGSDRRIRSALENLQDFDWLIFSSANGIQAFRSFCGDGCEGQLNGLSIAAVGDKTAHRFAQCFPEIPIAMTSNHLQSLLDKVANREWRHPVSVLHITSEQSKRHILVKVPVSMDLLRLPLYKTVAEDRHSRETIASIKKSRFDIIVFSSPTSFDYFLEIMGSGDLLENCKLAVFGTTTERHIQRKGYHVHIIPRVPEPQALASSILRSFSAETVQAKKEKEWHK